MSKRGVVVEVTVDSVQSALNAQHSGAQRVELCAGLSAGGLTPSLAAIETCRRLLQIQLSVMIRPRAGDFCYESMELAVMHRDIEIAKASGADGIAIGILRPDGKVAAEAMAQIIAIARPMEVTFHRAFDMTADPFGSISELIDLGVDRILTSGQEQTALEGVESLQTFVQAARGKIVIMPGGGINERNVLHVIEHTGAQEVHLSARRWTDGAMQFRNPRVQLGGSGSTSEYAASFADSQVIRAVCQALP